MDSDAIYYMLRNSGCVNKYSQKILKCISKLDKEVQYIVIDGLEKGGSSLASALNSVKGSVAVDFIECAAKHGDQVFDAVAKSENVEEAVKFIAKYTDDVAEIFAKYGDDVVTAVNNCDAPHKAIQIIKNGGSQYGEQATQAIKKSGNKAVEALTKVPSKECADVILKSSDDVIDAVNKLDDTVAAQFINTTNKQNSEFFKAIDSCSFTDDAVEMIAKYDDEGIKIFNNISDKNVTGLSTALNSESKTISFTVDVSGDCYVTGSGTTSKNPTITHLPDEFYLNLNSQNDYVTAYRKVFTDDFVDSMNVSDSVKCELKKLNSALDETREAAKEIGYNYGDKFNLGYEEFSLEKNWPVFNCAEVIGAREAILNGAKFDDLKFYAVTRETGKCRKMCSNCQWTFTGKIFELH